MKFDDPLSAIYYPNSAEPTPSHLMLDRNCIWFSQGTQDKRSARSIQKYVPRPPAGYAQKKVSNSIATDQVSRIPKKSQPSLPMVPRSTSSVSNISKPNKKLAPVKTEQTCRVEGLSLKSKIKPTSLTKSFGPNIEKDVRCVIHGNGEESIQTYNDSCGVPFVGCYYWLILK